MRLVFILILWISNQAYPISSGYSTIFNKCQKGGIPKGDLLYFLSNDKNLINERDDFGFTLLHWCAGNGRNDTVNTLLESGAFVDAKTTKAGETALQAASTLGRDIIVWRLLKAGANKDLKDNYGKTAADKANKSGHYKIVEMLGGKPQNLFEDAKRKEAVKLLDQAFKGEISVADFERQFAPYGPLIDEPFNNGSTLLQSVAYNENNELMATALRLKANPNLPKESGTTPLMFAASGKNLDGFKMLVEAGADPDLKNSEGKRAKDFAEDNARPLISDILGQKLYKDLRNRTLIANYIKGLTKDPSKFKAKISEHEDQIKQMNKDMLEAKKKAQIPQKNNTVTPAPVTQPSMPMMKMISDAFIAIDRGDIKYYLHLLEKGLPPDARDGNGNPMILKICLKGNMPMLQMLVSRGANINIKGVNGLTPLMIATVNYKYEVAGYLIKIGADKGLRSNFNWTAFDYARQNRDDRLMYMTRF